MTSFPVNPHRLDPYKVFKFQVILDGQIIPGVSKVGPLRRHTATILYREGASLSHMITAPGTTGFEPIVIERGITHDKTFETWAAQAYGGPGAPEMSLRNFRKNLRINLLNEQGTVVRSYLVYRAWVSDYTALPVMDASVNAVAIETIVLTYEGFEIDSSVSEPVET
jgi:phage tail-like protein